MSPARRILEAGVIPSAYGLLCGLALGVSAPLYLVLAFGILGGIGGAAQHARRRDALIRSLTGWFLFGVFVLLGFDLGGEGEATVALPDPQVLLLVLTVVPSIPLHWLGWRLWPRLLGESRPAEAA